MSFQHNETMIMLTDLKHMGFSEKLIDELLPAPELKVNPRRPGGPRMRLWHEDDVRGAMKSDAYQSRLPVWLKSGLATLGWTVSRGPMEGGSMADPKHPRHFTDDFKRQIVSLYNAGKPPSEIMREYDLGSTTLRRWINSINATGSPHAADNRTPEQNRIIELERENKRLRMEVDVLKQAALIFARK